MTRRYYLLPNQFFPVAQNPEELSYLARAKMTLQLSPALGEASRRGKGLGSCGVSCVGPGDLGLSRNPAVYLGPGSLGTWR